MTVETIAAARHLPCGGRTPQFRDHASGCHFTVVTPQQAPGLWQGYVDGALQAYRHFAIEAALSYPEMASGQGTSMFFAATDGHGEVVAGVRILGPYEHVDQVESLKPFDGCPGGELLHAVMAQRIGRGVVEARAAWVSRTAERRRELGAAISRCIAYAPNVFGVRYGFATVASFTLPRHRVSGGLRMEGVAPVPYPDNRYRTVPMWWDRRGRSCRVEKAGQLLMRGELRSMGMVPAAPRAPWSPERAVLSGAGEQRFGPSPRRVSAFDE